MTTREPDCFPNNPRIQPKLGDLFSVGLQGLTFTTTWPHPFPDDTRWFLDLK